MIESMGAGSGSAVEQCKILQANLKISIEIQASALIGHA